MRLQRSFAIIITVLIAISGCRKDTESFVPYPSAIAEIKTLLKLVPPADHQTVFTLSNPTSDIILTTPQYSRLFLKPNTTVFLNSLGQEVLLSSCNEAKIVITEYLAKSALVAKSFSLRLGDTSAKTTGVVQLECFCNGNALSLATGEKINIQIPDKDNDLDTSFQLYSGTFTSTDSVSVWNDLSQDVFLAKLIRSAPFNDTLNMYSFETKQLGLLTGMQPVTNPMVDFCVALEDYYLPQNTMIFLLFDGFKSTVPMAYDKSLKQFCSKGVPSNTQVQIIVVSKIGNEWQMSSTEANTADGSDIQVLQPIPTAKENIITEFRLFD